MWYGIILQKKISKIRNVKIIFPNIDFFSKTLKHKKNYMDPEKKDVNRDSYIASSPISQSSFFKGVRCLILASSQGKLRGYIEF